MNVLYCYNYFLFMMSIITSLALYNTGIKNKRLVTNIIKLPVQTLNILIGCAASYYKLEKIQT